MSKYRAKKIEYNGMTFDSKKELRRYNELKVLERVGKISHLQRQVKFVLIPTQRTEDKIGARGGVIKGKLLEKECSYYADFVYEENGETVVEDVKGMRTTEYVIKRKLMLYVHNIKINEI